MFPNRLIAFVDACSLAGVLRRNLLLSLAEAELFQVRWSRPVIDETEQAIAKMLTNRQIGKADQYAKYAVVRMEEAFADAMVDEFDAFMGVVQQLPDPGDAHVLAAALKTRAAVIVTENVRHFPSAILTPFSVEVRLSDDFIADVVSLDKDTAVAAVRRMRGRMKRPERSADMLLMDMERNGLTATAKILGPHAQVL